jgi:multidrug efflux system membrane fusion protein
LPGTAKAERANTSHIAELLRNIPYLIGVSRMSVAVCDHYTRVFFMTFLSGFPMRRRIGIIGGLVAIGLIAIGVRQLSGRTSGTDDRSTGTSTIPVTAAVAARRDVPETVNAIGNVQSIDSVAIQPRVTGAIQKIGFSPGQDVKQGQELFLIDPRPFQAALDQAKAQLAHDQGVLAEAQMDLTRYRTLAKQNSIAKQQAQDQAYMVQQDKGTVDLDQANVETAQLNLEFCHLSAPISGRAGTLQVDVGNLVGEVSAQATASAATTSSGTGGEAATGTTMVTVEQMQPIYVSFNVPQIRLSEIQRNQTAAPLEVDAFSQDGKLLGKGKLTVIDNQVNTSAGTVLMQATFTNADEVLWPGEFVRVQLVVSKLNNVVTVPAQAVMAGPNGSYVYVIGPDNRVTRVGVQVTAGENGIAVISKGLSGGKKVVTDGQYRLDDGTTVAVLAPTNVPKGTQVSESE